MPIAKPRALPVLRQLALLACALCLLAGCARSRVGADRSVLVMDFDTAGAPVAAAGAPEVSLDDNPAPAGGVPARFGATAADLMTAQLANYPRVGVVDRQAVRAQLEQARREPTQLQQLGQELGVDYIIVGSVARLDQNYVLNARMLSMSTGQVVKGSSVTRSCRREQDLLPVVEAMTRVLAGHVRVLAERYDQLENQR